MEANEQIRAEMAQIQVELEDALRGLITEAGQKLSPAELKEIEQEFHALNEMLERIKTGLVWIALFGTVSVGKSAIGNSILGEDRFKVGVEHDVTLEPEAIQKGSWMLVDVPGILGKEINERIALEEAKKAHGLVFVVSGEPFADEMELFDFVHHHVPNTPKIVFVNKWDVREAESTPAELEVIKAKIAEKMMKYVSDSRDIIYGSAHTKSQETGEKVRRPLPQLEERLYEQAGTLGDIVNVIDPANRAERLVEGIGDRIREIRTRIARRVIRGFATASVAGAIVPFDTLLVTPGLMASMVFVLARIMGQKLTRAKAMTTAVELLKACSIELMGDFTIQGILEIALSAAGSLFGPLGLAIANTVDAAALGWWRFRRTLIFGEVVLEFLRRDFSWGGESRAAVIRECRDRALKNHAIFKATVSQA